MGPKGFASPVAVPCFRFRIRMRHSDRLRPEEEEDGGYRPKEARAERGMDEVAGSVLSLSVRPAKLENVWDS